MDIKKVIKDGILEHMKEFKVSTYELRGMKMFGLSHDTIRKLTQVDSYEPNALTCKKALDHLGYTYKYSVSKGFTSLEKTI
tara:strand:- start:433 stop:675 length:243 start_codon:yes stop_codon:yes gene_type:complete